MRSVYVQWDYAVLDESRLPALFGQWTHNKDGDGIIPNSVGSRALSSLPLMAPKALRARQMQQCESTSESELRTPGRTPYEFPNIGKAILARVSSTGSVELFYRLERPSLRSPFHLLGLMVTP